MKNPDLWRTVGIVAMFVGGFMGSNGYPLAYLLALAGAGVVVWQAIQWWKEQ
jgi:hypothetical protein